MNEDIKRLVEVLEPFAEAYRLALITGHRPVDFVGAEDFTRAAQALASLTTKETDHGQD